MKFLNKITGKFKNQTTTFTSMNFREFLGLPQTGDINEVTYYTCMKVLSESLGKLSIHLKDKDNNKIIDHDALVRLKYTPNPFMTGSTLKTLWEFHRNHYGNSYSYLHYGPNGKLLGIYPLKTNQVRIIVDDAGIIGEGILYEYTNKGKVMYFKSGEILHFKGGLSEDGIVGKCVRETLATTLLGVKESTKYLNTLYQRGLTAKAVLRYTGDLSRDLQKKLLDKIKEFMSTENPTGVMPLPPGMDLLPLDLKLTDSQFFELKKYTALQIAAAFGLKPNHLNDYEKSSYASSEMQNLTFYIDTLLYILTHYEEELNTKLLTEKEIKEGLHFEFNVASLLRGDLKTQAECVRTYVSSGVYSINEARKIVGLHPTKGGDVIVMNGSYVPLEDIGIAYKGGDRDGKVVESKEQ